MKIRDAVAVGVAALTAFNAQAALLDRGGGLLYDNVLDLTWLQDANYAKTSGYDADGRMNWADATTWAANLSFHDSVRNTDLTGWRLAANTPVGADWNYNFSPTGTTDRGYNIASPRSELSYMFYVNLELKGYRSTAGDYQSDFGVFGNGTYNGVDTSSMGQRNVGPVQNLQAYPYWSGTASAVYPEDPGFGAVAWNFYPGNGVQGVNYPSDMYFAWAVRPGDVAAPIPEPETYAMILAGLGLLGFMSRRKKQSS